MAKGGLRYGAGRKRVHDRVEDYRSIDVRRFSESGMLEPGRRAWSWRDAESGRTTAWISVVGGVDSLRLQFRLSGLDFDTRVDIDRTRCGFGGSRPWFRCPRCNHRVAILYIDAAGFACRACHGLVYESQSATEMAAALRRSQKLADRLGPGWERPKGMHFKTCGRLQEAAYRSMRAFSELVSASTARLEADLARMGLD